MKVVDLKKERVKLGLTQAQMAIEIGVKYSPYVTWETGRAEPNYENKLKIKKFINEDINK